MMLGSLPCLVISYYLRSTIMGLDACLSCGWKLGEKAFILVPPQSYLVGIGNELNFFKWCLLLVMIISKCLMKFLGVLQVYSL
jgi:hypothetical protein